MTAEERLWTTDELADYLNVPKGTLYQWSSRKVGPAPIKVGKHLRYRQSSVEDFLTDNEATHAA